MNFEKRASGGEYTDVHFEAKEYQDSKESANNFFISIQPQNGGLEILDKGSLTLWPMDGVTFEQIAQLAEKLRDSIKHIQYQRAED